MDRYDILTLIGLILIGLALFVAYGPVATLAYAGVVTVVVGIIGARF